MEKKKKNLFKPFVFQKLYEKYEKEGKARKTIKAQVTQNNRKLEKPIIFFVQSLWRAIVESQIETGTPYIMYKDACNGKVKKKNWRQKKFDFFSCLSSPINKIWVQLNLPIYVLKLLNIHQVKKKKKFVCSRE